jgi:hypothetical protein
MNVLIVAQEFPYPANHGGRIDIWNKMMSFKLQGHKIMLVTWTEIVKGDVPSEESIIAVRHVVDDIILIPIRRDFKRVFNLLKYPSFVSARVIDNGDFLEYLDRVKVFMPDFVFVEQIYAGNIGMKFSQALGVPCGVRLHNREYEYMSGQLKLAQGLRRKLSIYLACLHLKKFEELIIKRCDAYYDISQADLDFWKEKGFKNGYWLPPITLKKYKMDAINTVAKYDLCFLGNLNSPNNVDGLLWFIKSVYTRVKMAIPTLSFLIMGSNPCDAIRDISNEYQISLIPNPEDPSIFQNDSNILINPVRFGSGVNIKSIDMLFTSNQVVTTGVGVQGLPRSFEDTFFVCNSDIEFSQTIIDIIKGGILKDTNIREELRALFDPSQIDIVENTLLGAKKLKNE